jgi:histidine triad (HIT) family protein
MAFTKEQAEEIKKQLFREIEKIPNADKEQIKNYIETLDEIGLEEFLKKNNIQFSQEGEMKNAAEGKSIFQLIIEDKVPSFKIGENEYAIAVLNVRPLSKGHVIVIPKKKGTIEKIPRKAFLLAQKVSRKIKTALKPLEVKIETYTIQKYAAINIIPLYKEKPLKEEQASEKELQELQELLTIKIIKQPEKKSETFEKIIQEVTSRIPEFY